MDKLKKLLSELGRISGRDLVDILLLMLNIFLILVGYYVIKTVREPLILETGGAELKSYAAAVQAAVLVGFVPLYSWFSAKVPRLWLNVGVTAFFIACLELFYAAATIGEGVPMLGFVFFIWVGIFSTAAIAQFWAFANDLYTKEQGESRFPFIAIGMTLGPVAGSWLAKTLFERGVDTYAMFHLTAALLVASAVLYVVVDRRFAGRRRERADAESVGAGAAEAQIGGTANGFALVFRNRYILLIAALLILLNLVNTTGEYILSVMVVEAADAAVAADPGLDKGSVIGAFYGEFFFWVNLLAFLVQTFVVWALVRYAGIAGVLLALPLVAAGTYALAAVGVGLGLFRWAKTAENSTDYSVMNTAKALLWLPTSREEKYKAKQAVDTFFVRLGDMLSGGLVALGINVLGFGARSFALTNLAIIALWIVLAVQLARMYHQRAERQGLERRRTR